MGLAGDTGGVLDMYFVQLGTRQRLAHAVLQVKVVLMFGVSWTLPGMKLTVYEEEQRRQKDSVSLLTAISLNAPAW